VPSGPPSKSLLVNKTYYIDSFSEHPPPPPPPPPPHHNGATVPPPPHLFSPKMFFIATLRIFFLWLDVLLARYPVSLLMWPFCGLESGFLAALLINYPAFIRSSVGSISSFLQKSVPFEPQDSGFFHLGLGGSALMIPTTYFSCSPPVAWWWLTSRCLLFFVFSPTENSFFSDSSPARTNITFQRSLTAVSRIPTFFQRCPLMSYLSSPSSSSLRIFSHDKKTPPKRFLFFSDLLQMARNAGLLLVLSIRVNYA